MTCYIYAHMESVEREQEQAVIARYLQQNKLQADQVVEDNEPGKLHWTERKINDVIKKVVKGDSLVIYEPNHIACSTSQILEILTIAATRGVSVHFVKYNVLLKNEGNEINTQYILNIISKIESDFV